MMGENEKTFNTVFVIRLLSGIISVAGWCTTYLFFVLQYRFAFNYEITINDHYFLVFVLPFLLLLLLLHICHKNHTASKKIIVCLLVTAIATSLLSFSKYYSFGNEYFVVLAAVFCVSTGLVFGKRKYATNSILGFVLLVFLFEIFTGMQQYLEAVQYEENAALFIKGSLENSGVYACYLAAHLPLISLLLPHFLKTSGRKYRRVLYYCCLAFLLFTVALSCTLIYQTQSRTAYIAVLVSTTGWLLIHYGRFLKNKILALPKMVLITASGIAIVLVAAGGYYLFALKKMSAMGRLMKTEITLQHFADHFWTGTGLGRFTWYYPQWQSQYFKVTPTPHPDYFLSAGESYIIFNEWLQWFKTVGVIGSVITLVLLVYFFKAKSETNQRLFHALKLTVATILTCGFTSYPLHVNVLLLLSGFCFVVVLMLARPTTVIPGLDMLRNIFRKPQKLSTVQNGLIAVCVVLLSLATYKGLNNFKAARQWQQTRDGFIEPAIAARQYAVLYPRLKTDGKFLTDYGTLLANGTAQAEKSIAVLENAAACFLSRATIEASVKVYQQTGNDTKAIEQQQWLCNFLPNRFAPKQELLKLYQSVKDTAGAERLAHTIISMPVKIPSTEVEKVKAAATDYLKRLKR